MNRPRLALSMGDPAGVGPELCCRIGADPALNAQADISIFGSRVIFERVADALALQLPERIIESCEDLADELASMQPGEISPVGGAAAIRSLEAACDACLAGQQDALVTAPIHKEAARMAGFQHPGHTEFLAAHCAPGILKQYRWPWPCTAPP